MHLSALYRALQSLTLPSDKKTSYLFPKMSQFYGDMQISADRLPTLSFGPPPNYLERLYRVKDCWQNSWPGIANVPLSHLFAPLSQRTRFSPQNVSR